MAQDYITVLQNWLTGFLKIAQNLAWVFVALAAIAILGSILAYHLSPTLFDRWKAKGEQGWPIARRLILLVVVSAFGCGSLVEIRKMIEARRATIEASAVSRSPKPTRLPAVQFAPSVAVMSEKSYTRSLVLPPDFSTRFGAEGIQALTPYLTDPTAENVTKLVDAFKRSGQDIVFSRTLTRKDENPTAIDSATVDLDFQHQDGSYTCRSNATYRFSNPGPQAQEVRFLFEPPSGGAVIQGLHVEVDGQEIVTANEHGQYEWSASSEPNKVHEAKVRYQVTGSREFTYILGSSRRRLGDLTLRLHSSIAPRFSRSGLFPTRVEGGNYEWNLKDVITSQSIGIAFPTANVQDEIAQKSLWAFPMILVVLAVWTWFRAANAALPVTLSMAAGMHLAAALTSYASFPIALMVGAAVGLACALLFGRDRRSWLPVIACTALMFVFLSAIHALLLSVAILAVGLGIEGWTRRGRREPLAPATQTAPDKG